MKTLPPFKTLPNTDLVQLPLTEALVLATELEALLAHALLAADASARSRIRLARAQALGIMADLSSVLEHAPSNAA